MQEQAKLYESELEQDILEKEKKIEMCLEKIEDLQEELRNLKIKYQQGEAEINKFHKEIDYLKNILKKHEEQKRELEHLNDQWENSNRILEYSKQDLEERLYQAEENVIMYKEELGEVATQKETELQRLRDEIKDLKQELLIIVNQHGDANKIKELEHHLNKALEEMNNLKKKSLDDGNREKENFNCSSVSVYAKLRPVLENDSNKILALSTNKNEIVVNPLKEKIKNNLPLKSFTFEKVYNISNTLEDLFEDIKPSLTHFSTGGSCCILSYGQTGSGKTYTMNGLISQALNSLSSMISKDSKITLHCIEVYNEQVRDLLTDGGLSKNWKNIVSICSKSLDGNWVDKAKEFLACASNRRCTKSTELNEMSSRSHCIYTFILQSQHNAVMQFVDLAGSEKIYKSGVTGDTLKETLHINRSLSALQDVITALESKSSHVPYRNSLLTRILKPSLAGHSSKVTVILNCSPTEDNLNESISTLSLGLRLKSVDLAWAIRKNLKNEEVERTLTLLEKERTEKNLLSRKIDKFERDISSYISALIDKIHADENDLIRRELQMLKLKQQEADRKLRMIKTQAEHHKFDKTRAVLQLKNRTDQIKRVMSADPFIEKKVLNSKIYSKYHQNSRIPKPGSTSCNTSKLI